MAWEENPRICLHMQLIAILSRTEVIYNILMDLLIGAIPFYIGDVLDVFKRSYVENLKLITGYIEDDKEIINKVNKKAFWTAVFIVVLCWLIYVVISWAISLGTWAYDWIASLF